MRHPLKATRRGVGDVPQAAPCGGEAWGGGGSAAVGRRGVAGSGPAATLIGRCTRGRRMTSAESGEGGGCPVGPHYSPGRRRFEYISNSNEFKLLQNLSNFDRSKNVFL
jgi:hypothetical protein